VRGFRKTAFLKAISSEASGGRKPLGGGGPVFRKEGVKSVEEGEAGKKESFDDFFESLMKGQGQSSRPGGGAATGGAVNLDSILSSLNQPAAEEKKEAADSRLASLFQKRSVAQPAEDSTKQRREHDALIEDMEDDTDFAEFLAALKKDYKPSSKQEVDFGSAVPKFSVNLPEEVPDVSQMSPEQAKAHFMEVLKQANPDMAKLDKWRGPVMSRSEMEADMAKTNPMERRELDEALAAIYRGRDLPTYVTGVNVPNPETGETTQIDLLEAYADGEFAGEAAKILQSDADKAGMTLADWEESLSMPTPSSLKMEGMQENADLMSHPVVSKIFKALSDDGKQIDEMQYWSLFPKSVKRWVLYTRTPKGFYNDEGEWEVAPEPTLPDILRSESEELGFDEQEMADSDRVSTRDLDELSAAFPSLMSSDAVQATIEQDDDFSRVANSEWAYWEGIYQNEQRYLPADLRGQYRFHIRPEEINHMHPRLRRHFSFKFASEGEITKFRTSEAIRKWGRHEGDSGNSAVQIAVLTLRINHLTKVLRTNTSDAHNGYRLNELIRRRRGLMKHLKKRDLMTYYSLLKHINLRDQVELWTAARK
jgi:small subunit ribosomal protein S15